MLYYHILDLQGALPMLLLGAWVLLFAVRLARRRPRLIDVVPAFFILIQIVHSAVFKQAGIIHAYWTYYLSPAIAVGGADVLVLLARLLKRAAAKVCLSLGGRLARDPAPSLGYALVFLAVFFPLVVFQARFAWAQLRWGMATGAASYVHPYDDQYGEILWAGELAKRYGRSGVRYFIDRSVRGRIEFLYYLDAPYENSDMQRFDLMEGAAPAVRNVMLVDLSYCTARSVLSSMVGKYKTFVWDRRFVAVEAVRADKDSPRGFVSRELPFPLWWRWLVNPVRPPVAWGPDPDSQSLASIFEPALKLTAQSMTGGPGGAPEEWTCPQGSVMSVISTTLSSTPAAGKIVGSLRPACRRVVLDAKRGVVAQGSEATAGGPWFGIWTGLGETTVGCKAGDLPVGIYAYRHKGTWISGTGLLCSSVRASDSGSGTGWDFTFSKPYRTKTSGLEVGNAVELPCPERSVAWGFQGRAGDLVDAVGASCVELVDVLVTPRGEDL
jgi:hypothetical protein